MTKRERLDRLMRAAEMLEFTSSSLTWCSCPAVRTCAGTNERDKYSKFVGVSANAAALDDLTEQTQLARQLAVLMYREAVKRGEV